MEIDNWSTPEYDFIADAYINTPVPPFCPEALFIIDAECPVFRLRPSLSACARPRGPYVRGLR